MTDSAVATPAATTVTTTSSTGAARPPRSARSRRIQRRLLMALARLSIVVLLLLIWEWGVNDHNIDPFFWGQPSQVWATLKGWVADGTPQGSLGAQIRVTLQEAVYGFIIGVVSQGFEQLQFIPMLVITPLTFLGGAFYSIDMLPAAWRDAPWWSRAQVENIDAILDSLKRAYNVDENRVVLSGVSDGGNAPVHV